MAEINIVTACQAQAAEIAEVVKASIVQLCIADHEGDRSKIDSWISNKTVDQFAQWIAKQDLYFPIAMDDKRIIGVGTAVNSGSILLNYVHPRYCYRGVSTALLNAMESWLSKLGHHEISLSSTRTALEFYRNRGWLWRNEKIVHQGMPCYPMIKNL